jgi:hypothetical protein
VGIISSVPEPEPIEATVPIKPKKDKPTSEPGETQRVEAVGRPKRWRWILGGLGIFVLLLGLGAWTGYQTAISARTEQEQLQSAVEANFQFQLGVEDLTAGLCARARDRFVYVIQLVPDYPGVQDQLVQASLCAGSGTPQPVVPAADAPAEPTATPDPRGAEQIFAEAQSMLAAQTWDQLLPLLDTLRKNFPDYQPIEVDRFYYIAYRNRGVARILPPVGDLERGIFDLNRAEQIGPLDGTAESARQWAIWYIVGASFWEVDWPQAVQYFESLVSAAPQLHDTNFFSATDRLNQAKGFYALKLVEDAGFLALEKQWCSASDMMGQAAAYTAFDSDQQALWDSYIEKCALNGNE